MLDLLELHSPATRSKLLSLGLISVEGEWAEASTPSATPTANDVAEVDEDGGAEEAEPEAVPAAPDSDGEAGAEAESPWGSVCGRLPASGPLQDEMAETLVALDDAAVMRLLEIRPDEVASRAAASATFLLLRSPGPGRALVPLAHYRGGIWTIPDDALVKVRLRMPGVARRRLMSLPMIPSSSTLSDQPGARRLPAATSQRPGRVGA